MRIIHVSDLHWNGGSAQNKGFADLVAHLLANHDPEAFIIISGDVVEGVNRAEWVSARNLLASLSVAYRGRFWIVLGNHDCSNSRGITFDDNAADRSRFYVNALTNNFISKNGMRTVRINNMKFIILDSNIGNQDDWIAPLARGELGKPQLAELEFELQEQIPTFIALHHKPFATDIFHELEDKEEFLALINRREHVKAVFFGHLHQWSVKDIDGIRYFESDNTTVSRRYRVINSEDLSYEVKTF